jgi:hypothetical protein
LRGRERERRIDRYRDTQLLIFSDSFLYSGTGIMV